MARFAAIELASVQPIPCELLLEMHDYIYVLTVSVSLWSNTSTISN